MRVVELERDLGAPAEAAPRVSPDAPHHGPALHRAQARDLLLRRGAVGRAVELEYLAQRGEAVGPLDGCAAREDGAARVLSVERGVVGDVEDDALVVVRSREYAGVVEADDGDAQLLAGDQQRVEDAPGVSSLTREPNAKGIIQP